MWIVGIRKKRQFLNKERHIKGKFLDMSGDEDRWYFAKARPMGGHMFGKSMKRMQWSVTPTYLARFSSLCWSRIFSDICLFEIGIAEHFSWHPRRF